MDHSADASVTTGLLEFSADMFAEPPDGTLSSVYGLPGVVEATAAVEIRNTATSAMAMTTALSDGSFATKISAAVGHTLQLVASDPGRLTPAGIASPALSERPCATPTHSGGPMTGSWLQRLPPIGGCPIATA